MMSPQKDLDENNNSDSASDAAGDSAPVAIRMSGIGKVYRVFNNPTDRFKQLLLGGKRDDGKRKFYHEKRALGGIDLEVRRGETLGIIGRNGSGKSTLLRILAGVLQPSEGTVQVHGRIAPLLALGAGFNQDFTGRENVMINASVLGLTHQEALANFDSIAAFADIGAALESPVKTYSSGMFARLAFAVAICVEPDVLIVDEILSVGDDAFARKCFARMEAIKDRGATILFVSHSVTAIRELCRRAILLEDGRKIDDGDPRDVITHYHRVLYAGTTREPGRDTTTAPANTSAAATTAQIAPRVIEDPLGWFDPSLTATEQTDRAGAGVRIEDPRIEGSDGVRRNRLRVDMHYTIRFEVVFDRAADSVMYGYTLRTAKGVVVAGFAHPSRADATHVAADSRVSVQFPIDMRLTPGNYFLSVTVRSLAEEAFLHRLGDVAAIVVESWSSRTYHGYAAIHRGEPQVAIGAIAQEARVTSNTMRDHANREKENDVAR